LCTAWNINLIFWAGSPDPPPTKKQNIEKNKDVNTSWEKIDDERLCLQNQQPGVIAWAKIPGHCWWPGINAFFFYFFNNIHLVLPYKYKEFFTFSFSNDYWLSRLLFERTEFWLSMDYVVWWLPSFRGD